MKWEYWVYSHKQPSGVVFRGAGDIPVAEIVAELNKAGAQGWEAVSAFPVAMGAGATNIIGVLMKRPIAQTGP